MKSEQSCPLCQGPAMLKSDRFPAYQEPTLFSIYHCPACDVAFAQPYVETADIYDHIYRNAHSVPGYDRYRKYAENIRKSPNPLNYLAAQEETYWAVKEALSNTVTDKKETRIVEIGSGLGYLTYALNREGYHTTGLDISATAVENAQKNFGSHYHCADLFQFARQNPESFDLAILTEVIEHVENPVAFVTAVLQLLKPGGRAIITTPNKTLYPNEVLWDTELPPIHYWWLSEQSMRQISAVAGTKISFVDFSSYYKNRYLEVDVTRRLKGPLPGPTFDAQGRLIAQNGPGEKPGSNWRRRILTIPFVRTIYFKIKRLKRTDKVICGERGIVLCAILQKQ